MATPVGRGLCRRAECRSVSAGSSAARAAGGQPSSGADLGGGPPRREPAETSPGCTRNATRRGERARGRLRSAVPLRRDFPVYEMRQLQARKTSKPGIFGPFDTKSGKGTAHESTEQPPGVITEDAVTLLIWEKERGEERLALADRPAKSHAASARS